MTNQEKKAELLKYQQAIHETDRLTGEIERWRARSEKMVSFVSDMPKASQDNLRGLEGNVENIVELTRVLVGKYAEAVELRRALAASIEKVESDRLRLILAYRYVDGMTLEAVAEQTGYSYRQITRLHGEALTEIEV